MEWFITPSTSLQDWQFSLPFNAPLFIWSLLFPSWSALDHCLSVYKQSFCLTNRPHIPPIAVAGKNSQVILHFQEVQVSTCGERELRPCPGRPAFPSGCFCAPDTPVENKPGIPNDPCVFPVNNRTEMYNYRWRCQVAVLSQCICLSVCCLRLNAHEMHMDW